MPDYNCYLVFILNQLRQEDQNVRQTAGLVLKNNVKEHWDTTAADVKTCAATPRAASGEHSPPNERRTAPAGVDRRHSSHRATPHSAASPRRYVREHLLGCIGDPVPYIRNVVGTCITTITMEEEGLAQWPSLLPTLYAHLDSPDPPTMEGALAALHKICEDSPDKLSLDATVATPSCPWLPSYPQLAACHEIGKEEGGGR